MTRRLSQRGAERKLPLPVRSDPLTIIGPSGERVQALVAASDDERLLVAPLLAVERFLDESRLDDLALEFATRRGRIRLAGTVSLENGDTLCFSDLGVPEIFQERDDVRVRVTGPAVISARTGMRPVDTYYVDLGGAGMRLAGPDTLTLGEQVRFSFSTSKGRARISGTGTVVRIEQAGQRVICFDEIAEGDHRRLMRFIFECERAERRRELERNERNDR